MAPHFRDFELSNVELRAGPDGQGARTIVGYAAVYDSESVDLGGFTERIAPGAFDKSLASVPVVALWQHRADQPLGRSDRGTLKLTPNGVGLAVEINLPDTTWGRDAAVSVERGDVRHFSFGFKTNKDSWAKANGAVVRTLVDVELIEVSPVTFPAYAGTSAELREMARAVLTQTDGAGTTDNERSAQVRQDLLARLRVLEL